MKNALRTVTGVGLGIGTFLVGQLAIENVAWWWTDGMTTFDHPLANAVRFGMSGAAGIAVAAMIGLSPTHRRRRRL